MFMKDPDCRQICREIKPICLKCAAAASFYFFTLGVSQHTKGKKVRVYSCRKHFRCVAVFSEKVFMRARHKFVFILPYGKNFNAVRAERSRWKAYSVRHIAAEIWQLLYFSHKSCISGARLFSSRLYIVRAIRRASLQAIKWCSCKQIANQTAVKTLPVA